MSYFIVCMFGPEGVPGIASLARTHSGLSVQPRALQNFREPPLGCLYGSFSFFPSCVFSTHLLPTPCQQADCFTGAPLSPGFRFGSVRRGDRGGRELPPTLPTTGLRVGSGCVPLPQATALWTLSYSCRSPPVPSEKALFLDLLGLGRSGLRENFSSVKYLGACKLN